MKRVLILMLSGLLTAISILFFFGCASADHEYFMETESAANVYVAPYAADIQKVAIMPFKAPTELIGMSVSDLFVTEMLRAGRYTLVERSQLARVLNESELSLAGLSDAEAIQVGAMAGADAVIVGTVPEYSTVAKRGKTYPVVSISARLIDCETGEIVWSTDLAVRSRSKNMAISEHARNVVHQMTAALYQKWTRQRIRKRPRKKYTKTTQSEAYSPVGYSIGPGPEKPREVSVSDFGLREVTILWGAPVDNPAKMRIERSDSPDGEFETIALTSPAKRRYVDRGTRENPLEDSTTYYYRLTALNEVGAESDSTSVLESMTAPPPDPPMNVTLSAPGSRAALLTWDRSTADGVVEYIIERTRGDAPDAFEEIGRTRELTYLDGGTPQSDLEDSTVYLYRVSSINRVESQGATCEALNVETFPPPETLQNVKAESHQVRCVPLVWDVSPEQDIEKYIIYRSDSPDGEFAKVGEVRGRLNNRFLDGGRDPGNLDDLTEYYYVITAVNNVTSESADSEMISAVTRDKPPVVTGVSANSLMPREVPLSWDMSPDEKVIGYEIWRQDEGEDFYKLITIDGREIVSYLNHGEGKKGFFSRMKPYEEPLTDDTTYVYKLRAFNTARAYSPYSEEISATTKPVPVAPTGLKTTDDLPHAIAVDWNRNPEDDIDFYRVEMAKESGEKYSALSTVDAMSDLDIYSYTEEGIPSGVVRYYRIKAVDQDGLEGFWSEPVMGTAKPIPDSPGMLEAYEDDVGDVIVEWQPPEQDDIISYTIAKKGFFSSEPVTSVDIPQWVVDFGLIGKSASLVIIAVDEDDLESEASEPVEVRMPRE